MLHKGYYSVSVIQGCSVIQGVHDLVIISPYVREQLSENIHMDGALGGLEGLNEFDFIGTWHPFNSWING